MQIIVLPKHQKQQDAIFVPVYPDEPFGYLSRLQNSFLQYRQGCIGILIAGNETAQ